jgi:uncharacterized protein (DUF433 family)
MHWKDYITSNKEILGGKPVIKGTRLSVEFLLGLFAQGWQEEQVLKNYPSLTTESIKALFAYAQESVKDNLLFEFRSSL